MIRIGWENVRGGYYIKKLLGAINKQSDDITNITEAVAKNTEDIAKNTQDIHDLTPQGYEELIEEIGELSEEVSKKANIDGSYKDMTVGNAEQLVSTVFVNDNEPYQFRTSGGSAEIGDREYDEIIGGSVVWNQKVNVPSNNKGITFTQNANGSITISGTSTEQVIFRLFNIVSGHKYFANLSALDGVGDNSDLFYYRSGFLADPKQGSNYYDYVNCFCRATKDDNYGFNLTIREGITVNKTVYLQAFDLTAMFGTAIADYIYSLEQANTGAGVAWFRKLFPKPYYAYNVGEIMSIQTSMHRMVGFNQWDEEWEVGNINSATGDNESASNRIRSVNFTRVVPNTTYFCKTTEGATGSVLGLRYYDADKNYIGYSDANGKGSSGIANTTIVTPSNCHFIKLCFGTTYGTTYKNDTCINLSWDGERDGEYEQYQAYEYPLDSDLELRGVPKLDANNQLYYDGDIYESDGTVTRRYGIVDLGTLSWSYYADRDYFFALISDAAVTGSSDVANALTSKYQVTSYNTMYEGNELASIFYAHVRGINIKDTAYGNDAAAFKAAMSGVMLVYELVEPTAEEADTFQNPQIVDNFGTEEYVTTSIVPVGHETKYANNLRAKLEMAPESPNGDGDYIVRQVNGMNTYVPLVITNELPTAPTEDGTYILKCTVSDGSVTYTWDVQS